MVSVMMYGYGTCTLLSEQEQRIQALVIRCFKRLLQIFYKEQKSKDFVHNVVSSQMGLQESLPAIVNRFGQVTRHDTLPRTVLQCSVEGSRLRDRQKKGWVADVKQWSSCALWDFATYTMSHTSKHCVQTWSFAQQIRKKYQWALVMYSV